MVKDSKNGPLPSINFSRFQNKSERRVGLHSIIFLPASCKEQGCLLKQQFYQTWLTSTPKCSSDMFN